MKLDASTLFFNMISIIPWWMYVLFIIVLVLKNYKPQNYKSENQNKEKGDLYEEFICNHFERQGYLTVPHGKNNGVKDDGIDIILKREKEMLFVQCKDWNIKNRYRIDSKEIQYTRMNVRDYINKNNVFNMYDWKILYVTSDNILHDSARHKIREYQNEIEHRIIPIQEERRIIRWVNT